MAGKIFINYRRADAPDSAGRLDDVLEDAFSREVVFKDVDSIALGDDFEAVLGREVAACDVFLAVIGPRWLDLIEARARDPKDFVRVEIRAALTQGKRVIPVLVQGAEMPPPDRLPDDIRALADCNAISLRPEQFIGDARGLITWLERALAEADRAAAEEMRRAQEAAAAERAAAEEKRRAQEAAEAHQRAEVQARAAQQAAAGLSPAEIRKAEELANWEFVKSRRDMAEHRDHLARFPGGVTDLYARTALADMAWAALGPAPDESALTAFLDQFPKAPQADKARTRRDALLKSAAERALANERQASEMALDAESADAAAIKRRVKRASPIPLKPRPALLPIEGKTCSVFAPAALRSLRHAVIQVWVHPAEAVAAVTLMAREIDPDHGRRVTQPLNVPLVAGSKVDITLDPAGLFIEPAARTKSITWAGQATSVQFAVSAPVSIMERLLMPVVRVEVDGKPAGRIAFGMRAGVFVQTKANQTLGQAQSYRRAFLSYASQDRPEVLKRAQMLEATGIKFFQDVLHLTPGEEWWPRLQHEIANSDIFYLFWSSSAKKSEWVEKELRHALSLKSKSQASLPDIVPIVLQSPLPTPPDYCRHIHFGDRPAAMISAYTVSPPDS